MIEGTVTLALVGIIFILIGMLRASINECRKIEREATFLRLKVFALTGSHNRGYQWLRTQTEYSGTLPTQEAYIDALGVIGQEVNGIWTQEKT